MIDNHKTRAAKRPSKPDYIPQEIWEAASYMLDAWDGTTPGDKSAHRNLERLLFAGPLGNSAVELGPTWERIVKAVNALNLRRLAEWHNGGPGERPDPQDPYRSLLYTLAKFTDTVDPTIRPALKEATAKLERIAELARELKDEWDAFVAVREAHGIEWTSSQTELISDWMDAAKCRIVPKDKWSDDLYLSDVLYGPDFSDLLERVAGAAEDPGLRPPSFHEYAEMGDGKRNVKAMVRHLDATIDTLIQCRYLPEDFSIGDTDLARILSAVLARNVSHQAVAAGRIRNTDAQQSNC